MAKPIEFHNTWKNAYDLSSGSAEGWVRSIYSRGMLAFFDATGDKAVLEFLVGRFSNYTAQDSTSDRSLTQIEALLEGHACQPYLWIWLSVFDRGAAGSAEGACPSACAE